MDADGQSYLRQMRRASHDESWLKWATASAENASSIPLTGYVWEQDGRIVGNTSVINFRHRNKRVALIANVAVHPSYRHRGIARAVTERGMNHAREHKADEIWLHVRPENADAVDLYSDLGFRERARRTTWNAEGDSTIPPQTNVLPRLARFWPQQREWLNRLHPEELAWYRSWDFNSLAPGFWTWLYLLFVDINLRQWASVQADQPQAVLSWTPNGARLEPLWLALPADASPQAVTSVLLHARRELGRHKLVLEHPAGPWDEAIRAAGFRVERTLLWMRAESATK
jgi:predicted N-acetyltransferase YhbS